MKKQFLALALITAALLCACGDSTGDSHETSTADTAVSGQTETEAAEETAPPEVPDALPERDFEGRTFKMITYDSLASDLSAEQTGDVVNDAIFARNRDVSERFNVTIETDGSFAWNAIPSFVQKSVMAGDEDFHLIADHVVSFGAIAIGDYLMNWYDIPYIDFTKPWWSKSTIADLSYMGKAAPIAMGDLALSALSYAYCYYFDKTAAAEYDLEDLYTVVNEGRWTMDYVMNVTKDIYKDMNGNNERDEYDFYGLSQCKTSAVNAYLWSCGGKIIADGGDGTPTYVYRDEKTAQIFEKVWNLCYDSAGVCIDRVYDAVHKTAEYAFRDGLSVFASGMLASGGNYFRDRESEYGILPYPKLDEAQTDYLTNVDGSHVVLAVPNTVSDPEFVGIVTEALNAESRKQVFPAFYETALKIKYAHDNESVKMIDLIADGRVFDMGYVYDNWRGVSFYFQTLIESKNENIASYIEKKDTAAVKYYDTVIAHLAEMAEE